ncbi:MAG: phosphotransferase family protein [Phycisphaeraceae bacterium]
MDQQLQQHICRIVGASAVVELQTIQSLWSDCGQVAKVRWVGGDTGKVPGSGAVMKHVKMPSRIDHPRGWNTDRSTQRKVRSYEVETRWYAEYSERCPAACRVPGYGGQAEWVDERLLMLEDLDASGFGRRLTHATGQALNACIEWLAAFHATFLGDRPDGLWDKGTYWHLDTRPDEYAAMQDGPLKSAAKRIDAALDASPFQTLVHGDAKLANFCFSTDTKTRGATAVAAVDFQYVGAGCGMKDLAYLVGGCLDAKACFDQEAQLLDTYFTALNTALSNRAIPINTRALEADWRRLYPYAWADFQRFLMGWSPGHWKISPYSEHMTRRVLGDG